MPLVLLVRFGHIRPGRLCVPRRPGIVILPATYTCPSRGGKKKEEGRRKRALCE